MCVRDSLGMTGCHIDILTNPGTECAKEIKTLGMEGFMMSRFAVHYQNLTSL